MWFSSVRREMFYGDGSDNVYCIVVVAFRQDATNSKLKQCHLELECGVTGVPDSADSDCDLPLEQACFIKYISDVIPVQEATSLATVGMTLKMLESLGCPTWRELAERKESLTEKLMVQQADSLAGMSLEDANVKFAKECGPWMPFKSQESQSRGIRDQGQGQDSIRVHSHMCYAHADNSQHSTVVIQPTSPTSNRV